MARAIVHPDCPDPSDHHLAAPPTPASPHRETRHHPRILSAVRVDDLVITLLEAVRNTLRRLHSSPRTEESYHYCVSDRQPRAAAATLASAVQRVVHAAARAAQLDNPVRTTSLAAPLVGRGPLRALSPLDR